LKRRLSGSRKRRKTIVAGVVVVVSAVLGYAWVDGGRQPVRDITINLPIPGSHT
jgi:hypothetical protein